MTVTNDGFVDYTLGKDYGDSKAGTVLPVDPERKEWLDKNGYGRAPGRSDTVTTRSELETPLTIPSVTIREV